MVLKFDDEEETINQMIDYLFFDIAPNLKTLYFKKYLKKLFFLLSVYWDIH